MVYVPDDLQCMVCVHVYNSLYQTYLKGSIYNFQRKC